MSTKETNNNNLFPLKKLDSIEYIFKTSVNNFNSVSNEMISKSFKASFNTFWSLIIKPLKTIHSINYFGVYLVMNSRIEQKLLFNCKTSVYLINKNKEELNIGLNEVSVEVIKGFQSFKYFEFLFDRNLINEKNGLLINGNLNIICKINFFKLINDKLIDENPVSVEFSPNFDSTEGTKSQINLFSLNTKLSKVLLVINGNEFIAYKELLNRSPRFANIFADNNVIRYEIKDIKSHSVFYSMIKFIYWQKLDNFDSIAEELMIASHKYLLNDLKIICENLLSKKLLIENVLYFLMIANKYSAEVLKDSCFIFIGENLAQMKKSKNWRKELSSILRVAKNHIDSKVNELKEANERFKRCVDSIQKLNK